MTKRLGFMVYGFTKSLLMHSAGVRGMVRLSVEADFQGHGRKYHMNEGG